MNEKKTRKTGGLGKGLSALLQGSEEFENRRDLTITRNPLNFKDIPLDQIEANPYQPRTEFEVETLNELAESIKVQGIIQPITVRKLSDKQYQLISGERRLKASKIAGIDSVPAYIRTANDQEMLEMALIENIQREDLNAIEVALSYQRLLSECELRQEDLGTRVGKNRSTVTNYLRLLKLPPEIQLAVRDKKISMGHARALISIENVDLQLAIFNEIIRKNLSVRKTEDLVRHGFEGKKDSGKKELKLSPEYKDLKTKLSSHFGTKISLKVEDDEKGEIKIPFVSTEDLNRILEILDV
ncbi:ParB/RepB/Spo0J family partition protein [Hyphobacterium sp. CCMP332]|nr:ParB/RepB/Spo0J family partition protein [Hyphobacterium sp. CCMP332]